ncbi:hypothetical protein AQI88_21675 [Streptomyces cellostaticus]|uniref:Transmembrane protein n=1 Tax=Streptomyces cellostaticus TaxID=67285 RepID=A0A117PVU4_9ACTN|nr:hypothetical protein [Streptomyces cellostaticus]KUM94323.1 hypothetical protein AQI88_21675 [Streptomyces cellostaticus]GHI07059.1 hypothetical protein Scel_53800 [Streptomyces cellostaticus]
MNPETYANLYGPPQPAPRQSRGEVTVGLLAVLLWTLTLASLGWLTFLFGMVALWGLADGMSWAEIRGSLLPYVLTVVGAAAVLVALAFAPGIRRLKPLTRLLLLGLLACPVPTGFALWTWVRLG